uniref:Uncharacterized protein n=1 Tax=Anas zonorhyncha TaxID=75864 RepID=A0A8B9UVF3_9AVES
MGFTLTFVLSQNTGASLALRVVGPGLSVTATVGQDGVLPCHLSPQRDARTLDVRWIRAKFSETVHHYRNGQDLYREQVGAYAWRTELVRDGLSAGSLDLRITGLRPSDDGQYFCTVGDAHAYAEAIVELEVSATGTDPHLSLGGYEAGGVRVLCRSAGWYPLPQLLWRNARGQHLPSVSQTHSQDQEGLFEIEGAVIVTGSVEGPLSCMVRSSRLQQERESSLHIAGTNGTARVSCSWPLHLFDNSCVLGREEFREGRHCWLVEVEGQWLNYSGWAVGVARESVERKKWIDRSPDEGIWALQNIEGLLMSLTWPRNPLSLSPVPTRIWVCLDCTQQQVSFINADNGVQIFTFTAASFNGESIRPWFLLCTWGIQLCLRDSTPKTLSPVLGGSCPSPDTPASPLLGPAGPAQE